MGTKKTSRKSSRKITKKTVRRKTKAKSLAIQSETPPTNETQPQTKRPECHEWTNGGEFVMGIKVVDQKRRSYNGFQYPKEGEWVEAEDWIANNKCGNGLHAWAWGLGLGDGKDLNVVGDLYVVVEFDPKETVGNIEEGLKCKSRRHRVVKYFGTLAEAMALTAEGRMKLVAARADGESIASGIRSAASSSGDRSAASSSGYSSAASSSGYRSAASSSGDRSAASSSGYRSAASSSGISSAASSSGDSSAASSSGIRSAASSSGIRSAASSSGYSSAASSSGIRSAASSSGDRSAASSSGDRSAASSSGDSSAASSSGKSSVAVAIGAAATSKAEGDKSLIVVVYWNYDKKQYEVASGRVGENGIEANVRYTGNNGKLIKA